MKGVYEFEVSGRKVGFKFGTYALSEACEKDGCSVDVLLRRCGIPYVEEGVVKNDKINLKSFLHLFWGAAMHYAEDTGLEKDFKVSTVSNWLDEIGVENLNDMMANGLTQYVPKNLTSLMTEMGDPVTQ